MYWKVETVSPKLSLQELIRGFMEYAADQGFWKLPEVSSPMWHEFLWKLKNRRDRFPALECVGGFNWDGPYPKNQNIQQVFVGLCVGHIYGRSHYDGRVVLNKETKRKVNPLELFNQDLAKEMLELAKTITGFLEN